MGILSRVRGLISADSGPVRPAVEPQNTEPRGSFGTTGTANYNGWLISSDYNSDFKDRLASLSIWERMRRSDPGVRETLMHIKAPILNASWSVVPPPDPDEGELEVTEFVRCALFEWMEQPWQEALTHLLTYLDFGHAVAETEFQVVSRSLVVRDVPETPAVAAADVPPPPEDGAMPAIPVPPAPTMRRLPSRQYQTWRRVGPRLPRTLWKWNIDTHGALVTLDQQAPFTQPDGSQVYKIVPLPAENLIVLTHEKWGDEFTGISLLRAAYKPWVFKEMLEKVAGIAYERYGVGIPVAYIPREHQADSELADSIETQLASLRAGEQTYVLFPGPKQGTGQSASQGYLLEIIGPSGGIPDFNAILTYFRSEIKGSMLARFSEMGSHAGGSRATIDALMEVYYNALSATATYVCEAMQPAIRRLVDLNYPGVERYPKLVASGIQARNLLEFAQSVSLLSTAGFIVADTPTRAWVRDEADAPAEDSREAAQQMTFDAQLERAKTAQPPGLGGAKRGFETNPSETARPRAENAKSADELTVEAITATTTAMADVFKSVVAAEGFGARTTSKLERAIEQLGADFKTNPPQVTFADGAFHIDVAGPTVEGPKVEIEVAMSDGVPKTRRIVRDAAGNITKIEEV